MSTPSVKPLKQEKKRPVNSSCPLLLRAALVKWVCIISGAIAVRHRQILPNYVAGRSQLFAIFVRRLLERVIRLVNVPTLLSHPECHQTLVQMRRLTLIEIELTQYLCGTGTLSPPITTPLKSQPPMTLPG